MSVGDDVTFGNFGECGDVVVGLGEYVIFGKFEEFGKDLEFGEYIESGNCEQFGKDPDFGEVLWLFSGFIE